jgi:hypothetical protein
MSNYNRKENLVCSIQTKIMGPGSSDLIHGNGKTLFGQGHSITVRNLAIRYQPNHKVPLGSRKLVQLIIIRETWLLFYKVRHHSMLIDQTTIDRTVKLGTHTPHAKWRKSFVYHPLFIKVDEYFSQDSRTTYWDFGQSH